MDEPRMLALRHLTARSLAALDKSLSIGSNRRCREVISCYDAWRATTERSRYQGSIVLVLIPAVERTAHSLRPRLT